MPYFTAVAAHPLPAATYNLNVRDQVITTCTSATRPASPVEGMFIYESDTDFLLCYVSSAWRSVGSMGADWITSTGVVRFGGANTNVTSNFRYRRIFGTTIEFECDWVLSGAPASGTLTITLPVAIANDGENVGQRVGEALLLDAGTARYQVGIGNLQALSSTVIEVASNGSGVLGLSSESSPFTWTTGDAGVATGRYRAAVG